MKDHPRIGKCQDFEKIMKGSYYNKIMARNIYAIKI